MVFNSFSFLFIFFPIFFVLYLRVPAKAAGWLILAGSIAFYAAGAWKAPVQLGILAAVTAAGVIGCMLFQREGMRRKWLLAAFIAIAAAPLVIVKAMGLAMANAPGLPVGLSFYTFQTIALLVYAYQNTGTDVLTAANGILFFPKLLSGPIANPEELVGELRGKRFDRAMIEDGLQEFVIGLGYKVILADHLAGVLGPIFIRGVEGVSVPLAWLGALCYSLQLYFDFCGYSRMAVGVASMLGIRLPQNFRHPYCSGSIREFWKRWHITLGWWFRTYVYIPLGGSRNGTGRLVFSTLVVWLLTGIWHGGGWNFVFWGLMMFVLLMGEFFLWGDLIKKAPVIGHIYVPFLVMLSWIFFYTGTPAEAGHYFLRLVGITSLPYDPTDWVDIFANVRIYLALAILWSTPLPEKVFAKVKGTLFGWILLGVLFLISLFFMSTASSEPFLYFSF